MTAYIFLIVEVERQPRVEVAVVAHERLHMAQVVVRVAKDLSVWREDDQGAVLLFVLPRLCWCMSDHLSPLVGDGRGLPLAPALDGKGRGERIDRLETDTVQTDRLLEGLRVDLGTRIHLRGRIDELAERYATTVVSYRDLIRLAIYRDAYLTTHAHDKLIDRVVYHLLDKDVDAVVRLRTISELTDIHTRTLADMLAPGERPKVLLGVSRYGAWG